MPASVRKDAAAVKRVFVVDDHPMIREGLAAQIASEPGLELCGEAEDVIEGVARIIEAEPDLVIADISLKSGNGIDLVKRLIAKDPSLVILVWSMYPENLYAERALRAGARGYVNKSKSASQIMEAVHGSGREDISQSRNRGKALEPSHWSWSRPRSDPLCRKTHGSRIGGI